MKVAAMQHKTKSARPLFIFLPAGILFLLPGLAGCPSGQAGVTKPALPHAGVHVTVACTDKKTRDLVQTYSKNWANQEDAAVATILYDPAGGPAAADLWVIAAADLPRIVRAGLLQPLPPSYSGSTNATWADLLPLYREQLLVWDEKLYGFPLLGTAPVCCYRTDWLQEAKLAPPQTWEQFADIAERFHKAGADGKAGPSLPPLPQDDDALEREFYTIAVCYAKQALHEGTAIEALPREQVYSLHYDVKTGKPRIDSSGFVYALQLLRDRLQPCRPSGTSADPTSVFNDGKAVLCLTDAAHVVKLQKGALNDKFGVCRMPGAGCRFDFVSGEMLPLDKEPNRMPYLGSGDYVTVVPKTAKAPDAAFALAAQLCSRDTSRQIVIEPDRWGGTPIRLREFDDQAVWDAYQLDAARKEGLRDALRQTLLHPDVRNPALRLRTPDQDAHRKILVKALRDVLEGGGQPDKALQAVAEQWAELDAKNPQHLAEYPISLGLLP
jgi:multiple sugar transport system substrate-binding protein